MQLLRTSFNLRGNLPWKEIYESCVRAWIFNNRDEKTKKQRYPRLLEKMPRSIDFAKNPEGKFQFAGDSLEYMSFSHKKRDYLGFVFVNSDGSRNWKVRMAFKRDDKHVVAYVSLECDLKRDAKIPKIATPAIIQYLLKFQDGDGSIDITDKPHIIEYTDILKAKNALTGNLGCQLPVVYLSCSEKTHALKPSVLAETLVGVAHVVAEKDRTILDRLKIEMGAAEYPRRGEIGICYADSPITILNKYDVVDWAEHPEFLVQDIFIQILKNNLSLKFGFSWEELLETQTEFKKAEAERERIAKMESMDTLRREWNAAKVESEQQSEMIQELLAELEKVTRERDQYKEEHAQYDSLHKQYEICLDARNTWEHIAYEEEKKADEAKAECRRLKDELHEANAAKDSLQYGFRTAKDKNVNYLPLLMPKETEMYDNECLCQLVYVLNLAKPYVPRRSEMKFNRTCAIIDSILAANPDAVKTFDDYTRKRDELVRVVEREDLNSQEGTRAMKPFGIVAAKNKHVKVRFQRDEQGRFTNIEASTGSDSAHGSKNEASALVKMLLWS